MRRSVLWNYAKASSKRRKVDSKRSVSVRIRFREHEEGSDGNRHTAGVCRGVRLRGCGRGRLRGHQGSPHGSRFDDGYDAAVIERRADDKTKIVKKHETPTRVGGVLGGGMGLATG